ncbi:MAG: alcohol dehydrogenase catalytic domain-containing protein [Planctomycetota bacterium]|nr:alcohol dehydrogenase catalytic domain-containing protein [Planctomycetota bacterium]
MLGLVKYARGVGQVGIREVEKPLIAAPDQVLIKLKACGVCATDLHVLHDTFRYWPPVVLGHEFSGEVVETGGEVEDFRPGDRVVAEPKTIVCGKCEVCKQGKTNLCVHRRAPGWGVNGGMTDYIAVPERLLHRIPEGVPYDIAALCEPLAIAVHEIDERCGVDCADVVLVNGAGPIGILAAYVAKSSGASRVYLTGRSKSEPIRFKAALALGADGVINVEREDPVARVLELTGGRGADLVVEASGAPAGIRRLAEMTRIGGRITCIGLCPSDEAAISWNTAMYKQLDIHFNFSSSYTSWGKALRLMASSRYDLANAISHRETIADWERVFRDIEEERAVKAMFIPADEMPGMGRG